MMFGDGEMFPHHCNRCFNESKYDKSLRLHVSRCGHVLCNRCMTDVCPICTRRIQSVPLSNQLSSGMSEYFEHPLKHYRHFQKIYKFHNEQQRLYVQHFCHHQEQDGSGLQTELQEIMKIHGSLSAEMANEQERIRKCETYLSYFEREKADTQVAAIAQKPQPRLRYPPRGLLPVDNANANDNEKRDATSSSSGVGGGGGFFMDPLQTHWFTPPPRTPTLSTTTNADSITTDDEASGLGSEHGVAVSPFPARCQKPFIDHRLRRSQSMFLAPQDSHDTSGISSSSSLSHISKFPF